MLKRLIYGFLSVSAATLVASAASAAGVWTNYRTITYLETTADGKYRVKLSTTQNPFGCSETDYLEPSELINTELEVINSTLLSAFLAGKPVSLSVSDSSCINNRAVYFYVRTQ